MPITDNTFAPEELSAALTANPALADVVKSTLTANKYVVQSEGEHQEFLKNHESVVVAKKTGEHATAIEKDVYDLTGIQKADNEKYYDYMKRAVGEKVGAVTKLQGELDALRAKGGNPNEVDKARIAELEKKIADKEKDYGTQLSERDKELLETRASVAIEKDLSAQRAKYKPTIPASLIELAEGAVISSLLSKARWMDVDGKKTIVFVGDDNNVVIDQSTMKPATAAFFLKSSPALKDLVDEGKKAEGSGSSGSGGAGGKEGSGKYSGLPGDVKTKMALTAHLKQLGIMDGTPEFAEIFDRDGKDLPLR